MFEQLGESKLEGAVTTDICGKADANATRLDKEAVDTLLTDARVKAIGFVGSVATGYRVAERAAGKALLLEMGGNGPLVVLEDADLDAAVEATLAAAFLCAGQSCTAGERVLGWQPDQADWNHPNLGEDEPTGDAAELQTMLESVLAGKKVGR